MSLSVISFVSSLLSTVLFVMMKIKLLIGGQIGHRKYDCPEQRNFTANIICRVCGNAGHMARDCPDRQRGQDWRNNDRGGRGGAAGGFGRPGAAGLGQGDAVDREYEVGDYSQDLSS